MGTSTPLLVRTLRRTSSLRSAPLHCSIAKLTPKSDRLHRQFLKALRDLSLRLPTGEYDFSYASARFHSLMDIAKVLRVDRRNRLGEGRSDNILID